MARVAPFRGLRYQVESHDQLAALVTPPYDVINQAQQDELYDNSPHNIIRLELNRPEPGDNEANNVYTRARDFLQQWLQQGILKEEDKPTIYINETTFTDGNGQRRTRCGFFARLRLEEFSKGIVLPHERTFSGHKEDRLKLIKATKTNISPIMTLYPDPNNSVQAVFNQGKPRLLAEFTDPAGWHQRLLAMDDPEAVAKVQELMEPKVVYIADGHHRYETGLNYRNYVLHQQPEAFDEEAPYNYVLAYMCSMSDPGMTVFASHRVMPKWDRLDLPELLSRLDDYFLIEEYPLSDDLTKATEDIRLHLNRAGECTPAYALMVKNQPNYWVFLLKKDALKRATMQESEPMLKCLDTVILTELVLSQGLGLSAQDYDQVGLIEYVSGLSKTTAMVAEGHADMAFMLNPTKVEQVQAVAQRGLIMPRKSTYFYPKILTGLVLNKVE